MDNNPTVSVIIPVYNGSNFLREAIDSVLAQTYTDFEIIVVDDGSTDDTGNIIRSYDDKIRGIHKKNGGVASALNCGIRNMRGRYFTWLSHDDLWLPEKLDRQIKFLQQNDLKICYSDYILVDKNGKRIRQIESPHNNIIEALLGSGTINGISIIIDKTCFNVCGLFSETRKYTQDIEMWLRLSLEYKMGRVDTPLVLGRSHREQGSKKYKKEMLKEEKSMYIDFLNNLNFSQVYPYACYGLDEIRIKSLKYRWFGNLMFEQRKWYFFGLLQYLHAFYTWPSLRNPAITAFLIRFLAALGILCKQGVTLLINSVNRQVHR
jgi:glycosyltransferase involved in cell wall biosynthesis